MARNTYVLRGDPDPLDDESFDRLDHAFSRLSELGYEFEFDSEEIFRDETVQLVWEDLMERVTASVIKERESGLCYLVLTAGKRADAREVFRGLQRVFEFEELDDLLREPERRTLLRPIWLVKMAIAASERSDAGLLDRLRDGLRHVGPSVRYHAALAAAHGRWPELIGDLEAQLKHEPEARVRKMARHALDLCLERARR